MSLALARELVMVHGLEFYFVPNSKPGIDHWFSNNSGRGWVHAPAQFAGGRQGSSVCSAAIGGDMR